LKKKLLQTGFISLILFLLLVYKGNLLDPYLQYVGDPEQIRGWAVLGFLGIAVIALALTIVRTVIGILVTLVILLALYLLWQYSNGLSFL
jgi:hypothetical protein